MNGLAWFVIIGAAVVMLCSLALWFVQLVLDEIVPL
jgi:hypothetical protein